MSTDSAAPIIPSDAALTPQRLREELSSIQNPEGQKGVSVAKQRFGHALRSIRKDRSIKSPQVMEALGLTKELLHAYERATGDYDPASIPKQSYIDALMLDAANPTDASFIEILGKCYDRLPGAMRRRREDSQSQNTQLMAAPDWRIRARSAFSTEPLTRSQLKESLSTLGDVSPTERFAYILTTIRENKGKSIAATARALGMADQSYASIEAGKPTATIATRPTAEDYWTALGLTTDSPLIELLDDAYHEMKKYLNTMPANPQVTSKKTTATTRGIGSEDALKLEAAAHTLGMYSTYGVYNPTVLANHGIDMAALKEEAAAAAKTLKSIYDGHPNAKRGLKVLEEKGRQEGVAKAKEQLGLGQTKA